MISSLLSNMEQREADLETDRARAKAKVRENYVKSEA